MKQTFSPLTLSAFIAVGGFAHTQGSTTWGSESFASTAIRAFGPGTSSTTSFASAPANGGEGFISSSNAFSDSRGNATSSSILDASSGISIPELRTYAATNNGEFAATGSAVGLEGYTYTGTLPQGFTLDFTLSGSYSNIDTDFGGNFAEITLWSGEAFFGDEFIYQSSAANYFEFGFPLLDSLNLEQNGLNGDDVLTGSLSWIMQPGDTVYLHVTAESRAYGPNSVADASSTLTGSFSGANGFSGLSSASIPEPSTGLLALLASAAVASRRRR